MTTSLNPKLLDVVTIPASDNESRPGPVTGTVVDMLGSGAILVEISDDNGVTKEFVTAPVDSIEVVWKSVPPHSTKEKRNEAQTLFEEAILLLQNGLLESAKNKFSRSFELDPDRAKGLLNSTLELSKKGAFDSAIFTLRMLVELQPSYKLARENLAITHVNRGVLSAKRGAVDKAVEDFTAALLIGQSPEVTNLSRRNLAAAHTQIGLRHVEIQRFDEAINWFLIAFELEPSIDTKKNFALALISRTAAKDEGRSEVREDGFREPMLMGLSLSECLNAYAGTVARLGDIARATQLLRRAVQVDPANDLARRNLETLSSSAAPNIESLAMWIPLETQSASLAAAQ